MKNERAPRLSWRQRMRELKKQVMVLYLACRDPRTPWYARLFLLLVIAYALSPIDLIPDFVPVLGYLDDLVLIPAGIFLALKMIPREVIAEYRERAGQAVVDPRLKRLGICLIAGVWIIVLVALARWILAAVRH